MSRPPRTRAGALAGRYAQRGTAAALDLGLYSAGNLVLNVLLARATGPAGYGRFTTVFVVYLFVATVHESVFTEPMLVFGAKESDAHRPRYLLALLRAHLTLTISIGGLVAVIAALTLSGGLRATVVAAALAAPIMTAGQMVSRAAYLGDRRWLPAYSSAAYLAAVAVGAIVLHARGRLDAQTAFATLAGAAVIGAVPVVVALGILRHRPGEMAPIIRRHWTYGRWSAAASAVRWIPGNVPILAVSAWAGYAAASRLRAAMLFTTPALLGISALSLLALPAFARDGSAARVLRRARLLTFALSASGLVVVAAAAVIGPDVVGAVLGDRFRPSVALITLVAGIPSVTCVSAIYGAALRAFERPSAMLQASVVAAVLTVGCGLPLVAGFGGTGAAAGLLISNLGMATAIVRSSHLTLRHLDPPAQAPPAQAPPAKGRHLPE